MAMRFIAVILITALCETISSVSGEHFNESREQLLHVFKRNPNCPSGSGFIYLSKANKCYRLVTDRLEWEVARLRCRHLHPRAHSVVIDDAQENRAIASYIAFRFDTVSRFCYEAKWMFIWTAGQRSIPTMESAFVWKPDNNNWSEMTYTAWDLGEPSSGAEPCMHLVSFTNGNIAWNDISCVRAMCVLCELDMPE